MAAKSVRARMSASATCVDASGTERPLQMWAEPGWDAATVAALDAALARVGNAEASQTFRSVWVIIACYVGLVIAAAVVVMAMPKPTGSWTGAAILALGGGAAWWFKLRAGGGGKAWRHALRDAWIEQRRCPSCAYPLAGELSDASVRLRCSECGGVWAIGKRGEA